MNKQIKLLSILGSAAVIGGVSAFAILATSCGGNDQDTKINLDEAIANSNIGEIDYKSDQLVKEAIELANPGFVLELNQVNIHYDFVDNTVLWVQPVPNSTAYMPTAVMCRYSLSSSYITVVGIANIEIDMEIAYIDLTPAIGHESNFTKQNQGVMLGLSSDEDTYNVYENFQDTSVCRVIREASLINFEASWVFENTLIFHQEATNDFFSFKNGIIKFNSPFEVDQISNPAGVTGVLTYASFVYLKPRI